MLTKNPLSNKNSMADPMNLMTDERLRSQYIETVLVYPRFINDGPEGGSMSIVLPKKKAYLSSDSRLVIPCTNIDPGFQFPPNMGIYALFESVTLRTESGGVICQLNNANDFYQLNNLMSSPSRQYKRDSILHGFNYSFEGGSGSKMNNVKEESEILAGQMRLKGAYYEGVYPAAVLGRNDAKPNCLSAVAPLNLQTAFANTAEFSIPLNDLLMGMFTVKQQFPLALITDELILDINFSKNGNYGSNDRAIFCPLLSQKSPSSAVSLNKILGEGEDGPAYNLISSDQGVRIMYDVSGDNIINNIRILDSGRGFDSASYFEFHDYNISDADPLIMTVSQKLVEWDSAFFILGGDLTQFVNERIYTAENPTNSNLNFKIKANAPEGTLSSVELLSKEQNDNLYITSLIAYNILNDDGTETGATIQIQKYLYVIEASDTENDFPIYTPVTIFRNNIRMGTGFVGDVEAEKMDSIVTNIQLMVGDVIVKTSDENIQANLTSVSPASQLLQVNGLGHDPVYSFDLDDFRDKGRINIVTDKVCLATDLIYYLDGKTERNIDKMMTTGYTQLYTQYIDVITSVNNDTRLQDYGYTTSYEVARQIGFSNEVLRGIYFANSPAGTQDRQNFPYYNQPKINPLLNKYCSMSSLQMDGFTFQINCNSTPYYSTPVSSELRMFTEMSKYMGIPNIPKCCYMAWDACRQLDNVDTVTADEPSKQPGYTTLDRPLGGVFQATQRHEINDRKMGICNQLYQGIPQKWALGMCHYNGVSFKYMDNPSAPRNGMVIGNNSVDITYTHTNTYNPWYGDSFRMALFGEVERLFTIQNGILRVTSSTF